MRDGGLPEGIGEELDIAPETLLAALEAHDGGLEAYVAVGEGAVVHAALLRARGVTVEEDAAESPVAHAGALLAALAGGPPELLAFRYLRDADSVVTVKAG